MAFLRRAFGPLAFGVVSSIAAPAPSVHALPPIDDPGDPGNPGDPGEPPPGGDPTTPTGVPSATTVADAIETIVQTFLNQPQNADAKLTLMVQLSGGYGTTSIFTGAYNFTKAILPEFNNAAYNDRVVSFTYDLYLSLVQQYYAEAGSSDVNTLRTSMLNNAVSQIADWVATNPPPGAQWVFVDDGSGATPLVVVAYAGTTFAPNTVIALPDLSGLDVRPPWNPNAYLEIEIGWPNESLFSGALMGF